MAFFYSGDEPGALQTPSRHSTTLQTPSILTSSSLCILEKDSITHQLDFCSKNIKILFFLAS